MSSVTGRWYYTGLTQENNPCSTLTGSGSLSHISGSVLLNRNIIAFFLSYEFRWFLCVTLTLTLARVCLDLKVESSWTLWHSDSVRSCCAKYKNSGWPAVTVQEPKYFWKRKLKKGPWLSRGEAPRARSVLWTARPADHRRSIQFKAENLQTNIFFLTNQNTFMWGITLVLQSLYIKYCSKEKLADNLIWVLWNF